MFGFVTFGMVTLSVDGGTALLLILFFRRRCRLRQPLPSARRASTQHLIASSVGSQKNGRMVIDPELVEC